jgi:hypothetical protein
MENAEPTIEGKEWQMRGRTVTIKGAVPRKRTHGRNFKLNQTANIP